MLGSAAAEAGGLGRLGVACLIISAFFTLFYMVLIIGAGLVPGRGEGGFPLEYSIVTQTGI